MNYDQQTGMPCVNYEDTIGIFPGSTTGGMFPARSPTWMSLDNNIRSVADCNTIPILGPSARVPQSGAIVSNYYVNETDRGSLAPNNVSQINANRQDLGQTFNTWVDPQKTTIKETALFAYAANPNREGQGSSFVTWTDPQKTKMAETTQFAYAGNAQRQDAGQTFITWTDEQRTTTKETALYSHAGSIAPILHTGEVSRFQYTGPEDTVVEGFSNNTEVSATSATSATSTTTNIPKTKRIKNARTGGARAYSIRGETLVTNYIPGPGRPNLLQDPDAMLGKINFKQKYDVTMNGPGTYLQSIPNATSQQFFQILAKPKPSSGKLFGMDDRQTAGYQVEQLKNNPLSCFTNNAGGVIPPLMSYNEPDTYTSMIPASPDEFTKLLNGQLGPGQNAGLGHTTPVSVYPTNGDWATPDLKNPVMNIMNGFGYDNTWNPMLEQGSSRYQNEPKFSGHAYSGLFINNQDPDTQYSPPHMPQTSYDVYGPDSKIRPREQGEIGIENPVNGVCDGNRALSYVTDDYVIDRDLYR
jgi:hypothetical protein